MSVSIMTTGVEQKEANGSRTDAEVFYWDRAQERRKRRNEKKNKLECARTFLLLEVGYAQKKRRKRFYELVVKERPSHFLKIFFVFLLFHFFPNTVPSDAHGRRLTISVDPPFSLALSVFLSQVYWYDRCNSATMNEYVLLPFGFAVSLFF